jgi:two-component system, OmpR family, phosphate regulon response regulator OmpR
MNDEPADEHANQPRILVVEDEAEMRALLQRYLGENGYHVRVASDGVAMERLLRREPFDLLVLDLMLPGEDGLAICARLRAQGETLSILMLTARGDPVDRIVGLEIGADDYLPKPFVPRELLARIQALLRRRNVLSNRSAAAVSSPIRFGPFTLDPGAYRLSCDGRPVELTGGEFALLAVLVANPRRPLGRERLIELAYGRDHDAGDRSIDVQVLRLRRAIEDDPGKPRWIRTVRGVGYMFVGDD